MRHNLMLLISAMLAFSALSAVAGAQVCSVDAYGLYVTGDDQIYAYIRNTGVTLQRINYTFYISNIEISTGVVDIAAGESQRVSRAYNFAVGRFDVKIKAVAECGAQDTETIVHTRLEDHECDEPGLCIEGATRCDCGSQRVYVCEDDRWVFLADGENEFCELCGDEGCCGTPEPCWDCETCGCDGYYDGSYPYSCGCGYDGYQHYGCGVSLDEMTYTDNVEEDGKAKVDVTVKNTGNAWETITVRLYVDGLYKESRMVSVAAGNEFSRTFEFRPDSGRHEIKVTATAGCGSSDSMSKTINVIESGEHVEPAKPPQPAPEQTRIEITPMNLDIPRYETRTIIINIHSETPQYFRIELLEPNFDSSWVEYEREFYVENDRTAYIYVTPEEYGEYGMGVRVTGRTEWKTTKEDISFFVAAPHDVAQPDWTAGVVYFFTHPITIIILILVSLTAVVYTGTRLLVPEPQPVGA